MDRRSRRNRRNLLPNHSKSPVADPEESAASEGRSPSRKRGRSEVVVASGSESSVGGGGGGDRARSGSAARAAAASAIEVAGPDLTRSGLISQRTLSQLIDHFPNIQSANRITRSVVRNQCSAGVAPLSQASPSLSGDQGESPNSSLPGKSSGGPAVVGQALQTAGTMENRSQGGQKVVGKKGKAQGKYAARGPQASTANEFLISGNAETSSSAHASRVSQSYSFFSALGPRVQNLLLRCPLTSGADRVSSLLVSMQKQDDSSAQLQALIELCSLLAMSTDEALGPNFPYKELVRVLIRMLQSDQSNFEITTQVCRALGYLIELAPRVCSSLLEAVPFLLAKLRRVECIDVAEAALSTLELLSRRHSKTILCARGIEYCLEFLDFFPIASQRSALQIVANCCYYLTPKEFDYLTKVLSVLTSRLKSQDKKTVELMCTTFSRLVENFVSSPEHIARLCNAGLLENVRQMLVTSPPVISSAMLVNVLRMLYLVCRCCNQIAVQLLRTGIVSTLNFLLTGCLETGVEKRELLTRSAVELYELVVFIGELLPAVPSNGLFEVDTWLQPTVANVDNFVWSWKQERENWRPFSPLENRILEAAHQAEEEEVTVSVMGLLCVVDLTTMMLSFEDDGGQVCPVQRRLRDATANGQASLNGADVADGDPRLELLKTEPQLYQEIVETIFPLLHDMYTSMGGPAVRHECLRCFLRIICHGRMDMVASVAESIPLSSLIAGMLSSQDIKSIVCALQLTRILLEKKTEAFVLCFQREGVVYQMQNLPKHLKTISALSMNSELETLTTNYQSNHGIHMTASVGYAGGAGSPLESLMMHGSRWMPLSLPNTAVPPYMRMSGSSGRTLSVSIPMLNPNASGGASGGGLPRATSANGQGSARAQGIAGSSASSIDVRSSAISAAVDAVMLDRANSTGRTGGRVRGRRKNEEASAGQSNRDPARSRSPLHRSSGSSSNSGSSRPGFFTMPFVRYPTRTVIRQAPGRSNRNSGSSGQATPGAADASSYGADTVSGGGGSLASGFDLASGSGAPASSVATSSSSAYSSERRQYWKVLSDKVLSWAERMAKEILDTYFGQQKCGSSCDLPTVDRLSRAADKLKAYNLEGLTELADVLTSDVTCFEILQSGVVDVLISYLTTGPWKADLEQRLRDFCRIMFNVLMTSDGDADGVPTVFVPPFDAGKNLVSKLVLCVNQLEQFPVKIHDIAYGHNGNLRGLSALRYLQEQLIRCMPVRHPSETRLREWKKGALKVDPLAQISAIERYLLNKGIGRTNTVKGRQVSVGGGGRSASGSSGGGAAAGQAHTEDESSDDDTESADDEMADGAVSGSTSTSGGGGQCQHRIQLMLHDVVLPYDMTMYQAIRQYSYHCATGSGASVSGSVQQDGVVLSDRVGPDIWLNLFRLWYRSVPENEENKAATTTSTTASVQATSSGTQNNNNNNNNNNASTSGNGVARCKRNVKSGAKKKGQVATYAAVVRAESGQSTQTTTAAAKEGVEDDHWLDRMLKAPCTISGNDPSLKCLILMRAIFLVCRHWKVLYEKIALIPRSASNALLPTSTFHVPKVTAKIYRQLQDPLVIVANQLPEWLEQLAFYCPFVVPFEARNSLFNIVALDRDRALQRLSDSIGESTIAGTTSERLTRRMERRKVCIPRTNILEQAENVFNSINQSRAVLEVEYEDEVGSGLGPTLEFYALVSFNLQNAELKLWHGEVVKLQQLREGVTELIRSEWGLYPNARLCAGDAPPEEKQMASFRLVGKLLARALLDGRTVDLPLSGLFFGWLLRVEHCLTTSDLYELDTSIARSVDYLKRLVLQCEISHAARKKAQKAVEELELDFTLPGCADIHLKPNGHNILVTIDNLPEYIDLVTQYYLRRGVSKQMDAVRESFSSILRPHYLKMFLPEEMDQLFSGCRISSDVWDVHTLQHAIHPDHGYTHESPQVRWLVELMANFSTEERRDFLQFMTGSPRLPVGGLKNLNPPFTVVRKHCDSGSVDDQLPSVMTCVNYLKLPEYTRMDVMRERLLMAIGYGRFAFHLS